MMSSPLEEMRREMDAASAKYGPFASAHEGYGVLVEEMSELLEAIHANDAAGVRAEAIQVSAVALRLAECCSVAAFLERSGM